MKTDATIEKVQVETEVEPNDPSCVIDDEVCPDELYEELVKTRKVEEIVIIHATSKFENFFKFNLGRYKFIVKIYLQSKHCQT